MFSKKRFTESFTKCFGSLTDYGYYGLLEEKSRLIFDVQTKKLDIEHILFNNEKKRASVDVHPKLWSLETSHQQKSLFGTREDTKVCTMFFFNFRGKSRMLVTYRTNPWSFFGQHFFGGSSRQLWTEISCENYEKPIV